MAKLKSGFFATWLKSCLAKEKMAISPLALNYLSENQESLFDLVTLLSLTRFLFSKMHRFSDNFANFSVLI